MQPVRKENSSNYKYDFPETWLGLEKEALQEATGLSDVSFCHKGGFLLTAETLDDAVAACRISLAGMPKAPVLIHIGTDAIDADDALLRQIPGMGVVDNASNENNENTRRKATVVPIKIKYV